MTNLRAFVFLLGLVVLGAVIMTAMLTGSHGDRGRIAEDYSKDVQALQNIIPLLESNKVTAFRHQDWCQVLSYARGSFTNMATASCCSIATKPVAPFDDQARDDLEKIWREVRAADSGVFEVSGIRYSPEAKMVNAEFDCSSGFSRDRYVFDPGHTLPPDVSGERIHTQVNADWYHVREDWH